MDPFAVLIFLIAILEFLMGIFVWTKAPNERSNQLFAIFAFITGYWVFTNLLMQFEPSLFWVRNSYAAGVLVAPTGLIWILYLITERLQIKKYILFYIPALILFVLTYTTDLIIKEVTVSFIGGFEGEYGIFFLPYSLYSITIIVYIFYIILDALKKSEGIKKIQLIYVAIGIFSFALIAGTVSFLLPLFNISAFVRFDSISSILFMVAITYAIVRHHLLNIKVITTELFVFIIGIFLFSRIFSASTFQEKLIASGILAAFIMFGILLIRGVFREVQSREQIEILNRQLKKSIEEIRKIDDLKSEFMSLASHQLRTPLTPIKGYADMLKRGDIGGEVANTEQREAIEKIYEASERMVKIIDDLLNVSKLEKEKGLTYNFQIGNPEEVLKKIVDDSQMQAKQKGLELSFASTLSQNAKIRFDPLKFADAMNNVLNNAIKYTAHGNVWIKISEDETNVIISVKDTGMGIEPQDQEKLFQKFSRGKEIARLFTEGSGLGLYFTKRVIEDHSGSIVAISEGKYKGSEFIVTLPKVKEDVPKPPPPLPPLPSPPQ